MAGIHPADYLFDADQVIPDWLVLDSISGKDETIMKSWFGQVGLSINDSIFEPVVLFLIYFVVKDGYLGFQPLHLHSRQQKRGPDKCFFTMLLFYLINQILIWEKYF